MMGDTPPSFGAAKEIPTYIRDTSCNNNIDRGSQSKLPRSFKIQQQPLDLASRTSSARRAPRTTFTAHAVCTAGWMDGCHWAASLVAIWTRRRRRNTKRRSSGGAYQHAPLQSPAAATATPQHSIASSYRTIKSPKLESQ